MGLASRWGCGMRGGGGGAPELRQTRWQSSDGDAQMQFSVLQPGFFSIVVIGRPNPHSPRLFLASPQSPHALLSSSSSDPATSGSSPPPRKFGAYAPYIDPWRPGFTSFDGCPEFQASRVAGAEDAFLSVSREKGERRPIGAAAVRRSLVATYPVVLWERSRRRPAMVSCVGRGGGGFANEAYIRYYEAAPKTALEAAASDLTELQTMGLVSDNGARIRFS
ncbi:uncharacterized protein LOC124656311 [Lolium rigidum]|uniref:uncharacterized protein LOC124656311 n=1 Tax=Lolium rigidum TaxID=89674 RepID=UPI001F5D8492|nr:uncharacterized protein LOC124656311 [Lolium rigidum]